jgi:hypothetical protein
MNEVEQKKVVIQRITAHLNPVPGAVNELFQQSLPKLEETLATLVSTREVAKLSYIHEIVQKSKADHACAFVLAKVSINGKFLQDSDANRNLLESRLQPTEEPSPAIYQTILKQYEPKFSWEAPRAIQSATEREEEFKRTRAMPKSTTLTVPSLPSITLPGLMCGEQFRVYARNRTPGTLAWHTRASESEAEGHDGR